MPDSNIALTKVSGALAVGTVGRTKGGGAYLSGVSTASRINSLTKRTGATIGVKGVSGKLIPGDVTKAAQLVALGGVSTNFAAGNLETRSFEDAKLSLLSSSKLPEYIRDEYPSLVLFIEKYYEFVASLDTINLAADFDTTANKYLSKHKDMYARGFTDPKNIDVRNFILNNKEFFSRKGTPDAFVYFFRAFFGEDIQVTTPNYLVASGGEVVGNNFIHMRTRFGTVNVSDFVRVENSAKTTVFEVIRLEQKDDDTIAVYFNPPRGFTAAVGDKCLVIDDSTGREKYNGVIEPCLVNVTAYNRGKYWQKGKIIRIPSSAYDGIETIARVKNIDSNTGISAIEIIQYGFPHNSSQIVVLSPFPSRPIGGNYTYTSYLTTYDANNNANNVYTHVLAIDDATDPIGEMIVAVSSGNGNGYFQEDYVELEYNGAVVVAQNNVPIKPPIQTRPDYTVEMWNESQATFLLNFDSYGKEYSYYKSSNSLLSDQSSKLHDNYYYQAYSYVVNTTQNIDEYRSSIDLLHPAGMKFFAQLNKIFDEKIRSKYSYNRAMSVDKLFFNLDIDPAEVASWLMVKPIVSGDSTAPVDALAGLMLTKVFSGLDIATATDAVASFFVTLVPTADEATASDTITAIFGKTVDAEIVTPTDVFDSFALNKYVADDAINTTDTPANNLNKAAVQESVTTSDGTPGSVVYGGYAGTNATDYAGSYWEDISLLTIQ